VTQFHPVSILIADDHTLFVDALVVALEQQSRIPVKIVGTVGNGEELLNRLADIRPDILLLDLNMPIINGLEAIPIIRGSFPDIRIMVVTKYSDPKFVRECLQVHNISGYVLKTSKLDELLEALTQVQRGLSYISKGLQLYPKDTDAEGEESMFDETFLAKYNLTRRELEILGLIAQAKSNAEIADSLFISPQTVGAHRKNIMRKLNISTTAGLVRFAIENQLG
jgi:DNA-binding NarL/FixJ family response regulator